jgi:UDP-N-acetylmuramate--alanine ligase
VLFQPHLYSRTQHLGPALGEALAAADAAVVTEIYAAREDPIAGVTAKLLVDRLLEVRPGMPVGWAPALPDAARLTATLARPGGLVVTAGAGNVDEALPVLREELET